MGRAQVCSSRDTEPDRNLIRLPAVKRAPASLGVCDYLGEEYGCDALVWVLEKWIWSLGFGFWDSGVEILVLGFGVRVGVSTRGQGLRSGVGLGFRWSRAHVWGWVRV